jgi:hypothetical protein
LPGGPAEMGRWGRGIEKGGEGRSCGKGAIEGMRDG